MTLIEKTGALIVGYDLIDNDHDEFISLLNELDATDNANFPALFRQLYEQSERHFERENQLMEQFSFREKPNTKANISAYSGNSSNLNRGLIKD